MRYSRLMCMRLMIIGLVLFFLPSSSLGQESADYQRFVQAREQGVLYWKKKRYRAADRSLSRAVEMKDGLRDFKTPFLVLVNETLLRPDKALIYSERALRITTASPSKRSKIKAIHDELAESYGKVELRAAMDASVSTGTFKLRPITPFINKKKKRYVERLRERYATRAVSLPHSLFLPYGSYNISGLHIDLNPQTAGGELAIFLDPPTQATEMTMPASAKSGSENRMWWIVGGVTTTVAIGAATIFY